ncbi:MAG: hypothetical protein OER86_01800 [Phycisphaerae bacterium]|nr:hypothetical protein [Phycisphaerae bacterium]
MRLVTDTLIALMLVGLLGGMIWYQRDDDRLLERVEAVRLATKAIEAQAVFQPALGEIKGTPRGFALELKAEWFDHLPTNILLDNHAKLPWVDHTPVEAQDRADPATIVADSKHATFWYNPYLGLVRARVPMQFTQKQTVDLYNLVNRTAVVASDVAWDGGETRAATTKQVANEAPAPSEAAGKADPVVNAFQKASD